MFKSRLLPSNGLASLIYAQLSFSLRLIMHQHALSLFLSFYRLEFDWNML